MNLDRILPLFAPVLRRALHAKQKAREEFFNGVPQTPDRIVFLGDSITEWTAWEDWFPDLRTANRGIGGQAIRDVISRLDSAIIAPRAISLLIGTNDLHGLGVSGETQAIIDQMDELVRQIRIRAPACPLFINSIMPRSSHFKQRIIDVNQGYRQIALNFDATYIDLWPVMADQTGVILPKLTVDGLHLSFQGYRVWVDELRPHFSFQAADLQA
jgi:lysophospholipase L1-like esterase